MFKYVTSMSWKDQCIGLLDGNQGDHGHCVQPFWPAVRLNYYAPPTHPLQHLQTLTVAPV